MKIYQPNPTIFPRKGSMGFESQADENSEAENKLFSSESQGDGSQTQSSHQLRNKAEEMQENGKSLDPLGLEGRFIHNSRVRTSEETQMEGSQSLEDIGVLPHPEMCSFNESTILSQSQQRMESQRHAISNQIEESQVGPSQGLEGPPPDEAMPALPEPKPVPIGQIPLPPGFLELQAKKIENSATETENKDSQLDQKKSNFRTRMMRYEANFNYKRYGREKRKYEREYYPGLGYRSEISRSELASYVYKK